MKLLNNFLRDSNLKKLEKKQLLTVKGGEVDSKKLSDTQHAIIGNIR
jgi:hypothetical protein